MNIVEIITNCTSPETWFRPVGWRGTGIALALDPWDRFDVVPSPRGGESAAFPTRAEILGDWEYVDPEVVLREREAPRYGKQSREKSWRLLNERNP